MARDITFGCSLSVEDYWDVPEFARRAEAMGFERVSMGEHVMDGNPPRPTLLNVTAMAAAAGATSMLRVMTGIVIVPWHCLPLPSVCQDYPRIQSFLRCSFWSIGAYFGSQRLNSLQVKYVPFAPGRIHFYVLDTIEPIAIANN